MSAQPSTCLGNPDSILRVPQHPEPNHDLIKQLDCLIDGGCVLACEDVLEAFAFRARFFGECDHARYGVELPVGIHQAVHQGGISDTNHIDAMSIPSTAARPTWRTAP